MTIHSNFSNFETYTAFKAIKENDADIRHWEEAADDKAVSELAAELHQWHVHRIGNVEHGSWHREMLNYSLARVDWEQLAAAIRNESDESLAHYRLIEGVTEQ